MSTASVKDHANTLLNLLDMERSPQLVCLALFDRARRLMMVEYASAEDCVYRTQLGGFGD
jgi:hypothetical protein